ncbi:CopG family transcriptional regulator [Corynebacterium sp. HS2168-gen11]|uniref:CopG family transcriptional regulator n=1 Tax=Corynebacterium sp. HS2168-gen11 TaxID=2974027 RepID=UPI00216B3BF6|nr:CopG family transcriptional regulator [Corynebacterium sp. HS2168-gen11]MCS4535498.1 CopG family transcriptional regulator [Corynebacterium sp. HS2168-gen11]
MAMTLRLTAEQDRALTLLAKAYGSSKQEAAIRAIVTTANRTLTDAHITQLAEEIIPGQRALAAKIRRIQQL